MSSDVVHYNLQQGFNMAWLSFLYPTLMLTAIGVTIYEHIYSRRLSLPLSPALSILTILLPFLAAANALSLPYLLPRKNMRSSSSSWTLFNLAHPLTTQILQGVLTTVLATLYFSHMVTGAGRTCELANRWQQLFSAKDARAIRTIQDTFECCGLNSVRDRAWPFLPAAGPTACAERFDRRLACAAPWSSALQTSTGAELAVVLVVALTQIASLLFPHHFAGLSRGFSFVWAGRRVSVDHSSRPLLTSRGVPTEEFDDEEEGERGEGGEEGPEVGRRHGAVGTLEPRGSGPIVEPSGLHQDSIEWRNV